MTEGTEGAEGAEEGNTQRFAEARRYAEKSTLTSSATPRRSTGREAARGRGEGPA